MRTKIVTTIGPASNTKEKLMALAFAGVSVFRLNFSHGSAEDFIQIIGYIREVEKELEKSITIMQDLSGPKIRLGVIPDKGIQVTKGMQLLLGPEANRTDESPYLPFDHEEILSSLEPGDLMVLADGGLQFRVKKCRSSVLVQIEAENSGLITSRKGLALPGKATKVRALTEKDKHDLAAGLKLGVDAVAISYVQTADDVREAKALIAASGRKVPVVVKL
nr:pyruvate kinase [Desulfovibrio sp.]